MLFACAILAITLMLFSVMARVIGPELPAISLVPPRKPTAAGFRATTSCGNLRSIWGVVLPKIPRLRYGFPGKKDESNRRSQLLVVEEAKKTTRLSPAVGGSSDVLSSRCRERSFHSARVFLGPCPLNVELSSPDASACCAAAAPAVPSRQSTLDRNCFIRTTVRTPLGDLVDLCSQIIYFSRRNRQRCQERLLKGRRILSPPLQRACVERG
jgi:hypothetical protein